MNTPGFAAEASLYRGGSYRQTAAGSIEVGHVVPAIPPCQACDSILEGCATGRWRGDVCRFCAAGFCDPEDWRRSQFPFPRSEPWNVPF